MEFTTEAIPATTSGRTAGPNPFDGHFPVKAGTSLGLVIPGKDKERDKSEIDTLTRQARAAAQTLNLTARVKVETVKNKDGSDNKNGDVKMYIWTVDRIVRPRKNAVQTDAGAAERETVQEDGAPASE